ncbi:uncharacterized protein [Argopecten irradians]|uniref:uncharacterized protein n=1 Tax=Argopecten irradians TaxID=31199 RepID=UPI003713D533
MYIMQVLAIIILFLDSVMLTTVSGEENSEFVLAKNQKLDELADCLTAISDLIDGHPEASGHEIGVQNILHTLDSLGTLVEDELSQYRNLLDGLNNTSIVDVNLRQITLRHIDDIADDTPQEGQHVHVIAPCVFRQSLRNEYENPEQWREPRGPIRGYRRDSWEQGVYRTSQFNLCQNHFRCLFTYMAVLPDGSIAVSDADNYEIRLFSMQGVLLRKLSVLPLKPRHITHSRGFIVFVRMNNLDGNYMIAEVDLRRMMVKTLVEFFDEFYYWTLPCCSPMVVVNDVIFVGCSPYLFMYDVNGTRLSNFSTFHQGKISIFHSEAGADHILLDTPPMNDMGLNGTMVIDFWNGPLCSPPNVTKAAAGSVSVDGILYIVDESEKFRVKKYGPNCEALGTVIEVKRKHRILSLAIYGDVLVAQVRKYRSPFHNSDVMIYVFTLGG